MPEFLPTLWAAFLLILAIPLGAIGGRIDGGVLETWTGRKWGKITTRLCLGSLLALPMFLAGLPTAATLAFIAATWIGASVGMWTGLGMARPEHDRTGPPTSARAWLSAAGFMTVHGVGATLPAALVLWGFGWSPWPLLLAGLLCAPCYEIAYRAPLHCSALGCTRGDPPPTAELLWRGALRGVAGVATVLMGAGETLAQAVLAFVQGGL